MRRLSGREGKELATSYMAVTDRRGWRPRRPCSSPRCAAPDAEPCAETNGKRLNVHSLNLHILLEPYRFQKKVLVTGMKIYLLKHYIHFEYTNSDKILMTISIATKKTIIMIATTSY